MIVVPSFEVVSVCLQLLDVLVSVFTVAIYTIYAYNICYSSTFTILSTLFSQNFLV